MSELTVSIVNTNGREFLLACLESLSGTDAEIVVLDNASEDGSVAAVRERHPNVRVIAQPFRAGFGANHNTVIRATGGRYILVLNEDTEVPDGTIERLVEYLERHPKVAVVGPLIRGFDGRQQGSAWRLMSVPVQLVWALSLGQLGAVVSRGSTPKRVGAVSACAMIVRRKTLEQVGLFDEAYFIFCEEADLAQRMGRLGLERHFVPSVEVFHHGQQSTSEVPERQVNEWWCSLDLYLSRYHSELDALMLRWLTGFGYALALSVSVLGRRLPRGLRPKAADSWSPGIYRLHARNAFRGTRKPGLRELATDWNRAHDARPAPTGEP
jgi:GT2 family glycosyltransferase